MRFRTLICAAAMLALPNFVRASSLTFTQTFVANFEFDILGDTVINPGGDSGWLPYEAIGNLTFTLDSSLNDPSHPTTVPFTNVTGLLSSVYPSKFLPYTLSPDVQFIGGDLTNIVRDGSGNVISANITDLSMRWDMIAGGGGLTLFTEDGLPYNGSTSSIPFSYGTVLAGPDSFNVYLNDSALGDPLVVTGRNRTLTAISEPSTATLAGLAALTLGVMILSAGRFRIHRRHQ